MEGIEGADIVTAGFPCQDLSYAGKGAGLSGERSGAGWWQTRRTIRVVRPLFALLENVAALLNRGMGTVLGSLAQIGYDAEWHCIPACAVGAPHIRDRVWIVAHAEGERCREAGERGSDQAEWPGRTGSASPSLADTESERSRAGFCSSEAREEHKPSDCGGDVPNAQSERVQGQRPCRVEEPLAHALEGLLVRCREGAGAAQWNVEPDVGRVVNGLPDRAHRVKALGNSVVPQIPELLGYAIAKRYYGEKIDLP